jgi:signal transduction histidine kinase
MGAPLDILIPARFRAIHREHVKKFALGPDNARRAGHLDLLGLRKNGEEFPTDAAISKLEVDGTKILTVALRDITEQKRVEKEQSFLAEFGSVLALTLDYQETARNVARLVATDLADICLVDVTEEDGHVQRLVVVHRDPNKASLAQRLQHVELDRRRRYLGSDVFETEKPLLISQVTTEYLESLVQSEEHRRILYELEMKSLVAVPLLAHGRIVGSMVMIRSKGNNYSEEDVRLIEKVAFRAALAVDSARLYQFAQRAIRSRDEVLGIVAHDLRNPLSAILMQASLLKRSGGVSEQPTKSAEMIERGVNRMNRLIRDLLDVTRMEGGRLVIEPDRVSSRQMVLDCIDAHKLLAKSAALHLYAETAPLLDDVWGDRDRLFQVFENLIGNAIKFTRPGGSITVGAKSKNGFVLFWVADTGTGIHQDDLSHVFERFWQMRKSERRGAGLGLPIVKGIVEAHGGRIWVESTLGKGSTFYFTIPMVTLDTHSPLH